MTTRPLFDPPPITLPKPRPGSKTPTLPPLPAKKPPETWRIDIVTLPGDTVPPIVRIKKLLKMALRAYRLKAVSVEPLAVVATPGESSACQSSNGQPMRETGCNEAIKENKP
jgi:hypothetical protein